MTQDLHVPWDSDPGDLYQHAPCGYLTTLPDGTILTVNETFLSWTGHRRADLVGRRRFRDLLTPGGQIYHETHYAPLLITQGAAHGIAFDLRCVDGRRLPALVDSVVRRDSAGSPQAVRTTVVDATRRRGYERELLAARRAAEASERRVLVLQRIVADLAAAATEAEVADILAAAPGAAFGAADAGIWLFDPDRDRLVAVASTLDDDPGPDVVPHGSPRPVTEVVRRGDLHVVGSLRDAELRFPELAAAMRRNGRDVVVLLPLTTTRADEPDGAQVLGLLAFDFAGERVLTDGELRMVRLLGRQAGQAIDRARLYDDARRREARAVFLAATTRALIESPGLPTRARTLVDRLVPGVAQWAAVRLRAGLAGLTADAGGPAPEPVHLADRVAEVVASGVAQLSDPDGPDPECAVLPLTARGRVLGTLALRMVSGGRAASAEAAFLTDLAERAGLALENARLYEQDRVIARTLQRSLLAMDLPADSRFGLETYYRAAAADLEVGGHWFDAFPIGPDKLGLVIGAVAGRGIEAAAAMGQLRSAIRALAVDDGGPARVLRRLDRFVDRVADAQLATVGYAEVALVGGSMTYACAGHPPPLLYEPAGAPRYLRDAGSAPLGAQSPGTDRIERQVGLHPGSRLLLFTDSLIACRDQPAEAGYARLAGEFARRRDAPLRGLAGALAEALAAGDADDDVCVLCLELGAEQRLARSIGADPRQIAALRRDLRAWLAEHELDDETVHAVMLACSEAVANAIEHGYRDDPFGVVEVAATVTVEAVEIRVADRGSWRPARTEVSRGRGLQIIRQVMDEVSFERSGGTTVTMRRARAGPRS